MLVTPASRALFLSISSIWGWRSVARTVPLGPTRRARRMLW